jgi:hypothetical protein
MASPDLTRPLAQPVSVSLALGSTAAIREVIDMSPLDLGAGLDVILGWDWISSHDLRFLYPQGSITGVAGSNTLELPLEKLRRRLNFSSRTGNFAACSATSPMISRPNLTAVLVPTRSRRPSPRPPPAASLDR